MAEQLALVTMKPPDCLRQVWSSMSARWSEFTSGMTSGTLGCMRQALELETTALPASANCGSSSRAMSASRAAKMILGAPFGLAGETFISATLRGSGVFMRHFTASPYGLSAERSDAASHATSNHG